MEKVRIGNGRHIFKRISSGKKLLSCCRFCYKEVSTFRRRIHSFAAPANSIEIILKIIIVRFYRAKRTGVNSICSYNMQQSTKFYLSRLYFIQYLFCTSSNQCIKIYHIFNFDLITFLTVPPILYS